ncbi:MAG TPA: LLM class flavin-dependent oxidoreductase [Candidatus Poseidoniales archaeon]|jgi:alkanesulfonate monooxygenase SsuD/methylene tetrahydromethanopterin reductase-like flavin-dependent oxidoreductase (luciferase family)|nr:LLM class flavin-dependent oxidoreductase [Candidatus Poseidoniales archaeon]HIL65256.1 LLM class flavin-dependent oxidoreductase [Candidatus Poseidoniales archaeon]
MEFDIFFSISQTPDHNGFTPSESEMFESYFSQLKAADRLGFGVGWLAQAHLSTETQKSNSSPVVPHWQGEVGLCTDFYQLALMSFQATSNIEIGSAVVSILASGGPIANAERVANTVQYLSMIDKKRKLHFGFAAGRFEFMARPYGIVPRNPVEKASWPALRGQIFMEASEIFLRLLRGDTIGSDDIRSTTLTRQNFRSDEDWAAVQEANQSDDDSIEIQKRYQFEQISIVPKNWPRQQLELVAGTHDPRAQEFVNQILPVKVFNLSITSPEIIDATHEKMSELFHPDGGKWQRRDMPRTVFVFLNAEEGLSSTERSQAAKVEAKNALGEYWKALEGTIDPSKVEKASNNALIGNPAQVAAQILERFHPDDRIMCWFDFFNHDSARVIRNMEAWWEQVVPLLDVN